MEQTVLITGAASGIGLAILHRLAGSGVRVICIDRNRPPAYAPAALAIRADLADADALDSAITEALSHAPDICGLVNCAGIYPVTDMLDLGADEWDRVMAINLRAPFLMTQALARHWKRHEQPGAVVNVASTAAVLARPGVAHYAASKAGLIQLTRVMAVELAPLGVRVNAVAPGLIATDAVMAHAAGAGAAEHGAKLARIPAGREGQPDEIARAIVWLLSEDAAYATGAVLTLDGGFTLGIPAY